MCKSKLLVILTWYPDVAPQIVILERHKTIRVRSISYFTKNLWYVLCIYIHLGGKNHILEIFRWSYDLGVQKNRFTIILCDSIILQTPNGYIEI